VSKRKPPSSSRYTIFFVVVLCLASALILAVTATALRSREERARELDRVKQILAAARIYNPAGYFQIKEEGKWVPAAYDSAQAKLVPGTVKDKATAKQIYTVSQARLLPRLTDEAGKIQTFEEAGIHLADYIAQNAKAGFADLPEKLFYIVLPNGADSPLEGYIIPLAGFGLWGPIYGYVALEPNADTVIGNTWQAPLETPGLGANIQYPSWQAQFEGKQIFLPSATGETNFEQAPLGILVVKGKVSDIFGESNRAKSAVDGVTGATLTGNGVTSAYAASLAPYRNLLIELHKKYTKENGGSETPTP
jgi:Na+-transporting NADH:ubiquinone oxidoreductase subunit C